jgi:hypothetical protein
VFVAPFDASSREFAVFGDGLRRLPRADGVLSIDVARIGQESLWELLRPGAGNVKEEFMRYVKVLGLLAVAAAALMAFASTALADVATSPTGTTYTVTDTKEKEGGGHETVFTRPLSAEAEGHAVLDNPIAKIECPSTVSGEIESEDKEGENVSGSIKSLTFNNCTDSWHVTVVSAGSLSVNGSAGSYNGDVFSTGATVEATRFGITCRYATSNTTVGTATSGSPATMHINANIPFHSGSVFCGSGATAWTGSYEVSAPSSLYVEGTNWL